MKAKYFSLILLCFSINGCDTQIIHYEKDDVAWPKSYVSNQTINYKSDKANNISALKMQASQGRVRSQLRLANKLFYGEDVFQNVPKALYWYRKAALRGSSYAQLLLSMVYGENITGESHFITADYWWRLANSRQTKLLQRNKYLLAQKMLINSSPIYNVRRAKELLSQSANHHYIKSQNLLGDIYQQENNRSSIYKALNWYGKAAAQGSYYAQYNIGLIYYHCNSIPKDYSKAIKWLTYAAQANFAPAQYALGKIYAHNIKYKNLPLAYAWMQLAKDRISQKDGINGEIGYLNWHMSIADSTRANALLKQFKKRFT